MPPPPQKKSNLHLLWIKVLHTNYQCHKPKDNTVNRLNMSIGFIVIDR